MKIPIKILISFLSVAPMTTMAVEVDDTTPPQGTKRPYSSIKIEKEEEGSQEHKRQRTQAYEIMAALDEKEQHGEEYKEKYKGSEKYNKIAQYRENLDSLKKFTPEIRKLILGDDHENRLSDLEALFNQLVEKYYCNFFAQPTSQDDNSKVYLSDELKDLIFSYCSMQDFANLLLVSHEARDAVYSLVPVFKEIVKCGQYKDMDEFLSDFRDGRPRAHAAIGITQYKTQYKRSNRESRPPRNKWLDSAFKAYDLSAVSFVFQKHLFMNAEKCQDNIYENFKIIKEVYKKQKVGTDLSLDKNVAHYLDERLEARKSKKEVLKVLDILTTSLSGSIEANLILYEAHLTGITTSQGKKLSVLPINLDKAYECYNKANEIASTLPSFQRGTACYEIGLWRLIKGSLSTYDGDILAPGPALTIINQQWNQAMDAWTEAEEGNRQKAVAHFKKFLMESPLFPRVNCTLKCSSSQPTFFSTTEYYDYRRILKGKERIAFNFLKELYEKDKEGDDQLKPYDEDINMCLRMARYYYFWAGYDAPNPLNEDANNATFLFNRAIMIHLKNCDEEMRDKFTKQLNAISQGGLIWIGTLDAYEHVLKQLGLGDLT